MAVLHGARSPSVSKVVLQDAPDHTSPRGARIDQKASHTRRQSICRTSTSRCYFRRRHNRHIPVASGGTEQGSGAAFTVAVNVCLAKEILRGGIGADNGSRL